MEHNVMTLSQPPLSQSFVQQQIRISHILIPSSFSLPNVYFKFYNNQQNLFGFQDRISLDKKKLVEEGKDLKSLKSKSDLSQLKTSKVIYQWVVTTVRVQINLQYKFMKRPWKTVSITIAYFICPLENNSVCTQTSLY